ncbi:MAG: secondary thiamine-phosphate synthase enzyme YjbQ [Gammaproteobacteria bacterium]|nr:secondary thiamine-phosphate synthase enzyme YjbQ [Gammaproteobacteria bacterium]
MTYQETFTLRTSGRGTTEITQQVQNIVRNANIDTGLCHIFQHHTSASLLLNENADPAVRQDLETFFSRLVPDGDPMFTHRDEGPDDMSAHVRNVLTTNGLTIPVTRHRCHLGTWQGVYLWEHRTIGHSRTITVTVQG